MKKTILYILLCFLTMSPLLAQQIPLYTQSTFNNFGINPAFAGSKDCIDFRAGYRLQWAGIDGHPGTAFINGHGKITPKRINGPEWFMGIGARIVSDSEGPFNSLRMELAWSIHVRLGRHLFGSFGIFAGILQNKFSLNGVKLSNFNDPALLGSSSNILAPSVTPGLLVYGKNFFIGLTAQDIVSLDYKDVGFNSRTETHYIFKASNSFKLTPKTSLIPSIIIRGVKNAPVAFEINALYDYNNRFQIGAAYRNESSVSGLFRIRLFASLTLGLSYDYVINDLNLGTSGSYEIIIGFNTCDIGKGITTRCAAFN